MILNLRSLIAKIIQMLSVNDGRSAQQIEKVIEKRTIKETPLARHDVIRLIKENGGPEKLDLSNQYMSGIDLSGLNLQYINLSNATLIDANIQNAFLQKANFRDARLTRANLSNSSLWSADFRNAYLEKSNLSFCYIVETKLQGSILSGADFDGCVFRNLYLSETVIDRDSLQQGLLQENYLQYYQALLDTEKKLIHFRGHRFTDEDLKNRFLSQRFKEAEDIYRQVKNNFTQLGLYRDASWAYRKERRMRKSHTLLLAKSALTRLKLISALKGFLRWLSDVGVELLCDYGESVQRALGWGIFLVFVGGPILLIASGHFSWTEDARKEYFSMNTSIERLSFSYLQVVLYMLDVVTTSNYSNLMPINDLTRLVSGLMATVGIFLLGLIGFVAGNRIRQA